MLSLTRELVYLEGCVHFAFLCNLGHVVTESELLEQRLQHARVDAGLPFLDRVRHGGWYTLR